MDRTVPLPAAAVLDKIASVEAPNGYDTIYGNNQGKLPKPLTRMTLGEVLAAGPSWAKRFGSSAVGRYQFMAGTKNTLAGLKEELGLRDAQIFDPNLQDRLGYHLLRRRGYDKWIAGQMSTDQFMVNLAKEWAAFPVPYDMKGHKINVRRGQSYYASVGNNKAHLEPGKLWLFLEQVRRENDVRPVPIDPVKPPPLDTDPVPDDLVISLWEAFRDVFNQWLAQRKV